MQKRQPDLDLRSHSQMISGIRQDQAAREQSYRGQALKLFPHVCARCGREFDGKRLRELTVHHKDNDHMNNPPDGTNWELLCLYCHDDAHEAYERAGGSGLNAGRESALNFQPFEALKHLLKKEDDASRNP